MTLACLRCGETGSGYEGCPACRQEGVFVNLAPRPADLTDRDLAGFGGGLYEWRDTLPIAPGVPPVTLGEGNTPSVSLRTDPGCGPLAIKNEAANPTWSHKDRGMSAAPHQGPGNRRHHRRDRLKRERRRGGGRLLGKGRLAMRGAYHRGHPSSDGEAAGRGRGHLRRIPINHRAQPYVGGGRQGTRLVSGRIHR